MSRFITWIKSAIKQVETWIKNTGNRIANGVKTPKFWKAISVLTRSVVRATVVSFLLVLTEHPAMEMFPDAAAEFEPLYDVAHEVVRLIGLLYSWTAQFLSNVK